ncbi:uncharacterized protein C17orf80 homolog [Trichomycterus rosablanca]|uniref:uncharacterized protein C17orf80 homolog n=1 Tax=Trichomycterus rosablanca TaxID=2290929 RepID=UPI002F356E5C
MILETCPYCGRPFKRLKAHLPHCKLSPCTKPTKSSNILKEIQTNTSQKITNNIKTNKKLKNSSFQTNSKTNQKPKSKDFGNAIVDKQNCLTNGQETVTEVPTAEGLTTDTVKPKMKWLAKREEEMLKQANFLTWKEIKLKSISKQEDHNRKTSPEKETPLLNTANTTTITTNIKTTESFRVKQTSPTPIIHTDILEQIQSIPENFTNDYSLNQKIQEQTDVTFMQAKTSVWDHIKYGLHDRRSDCVPLIHKVCKWNNLVDHTVNNENATIDSSSLQVLPNVQTSSQRPVEQILSSQLQNINIMGYTPDMATGYKALFFSPHSEMTYNEDLLTKHQSSKSSPQSQDYIKEQKLGDVKLREAAVWLGSRAPTSSREAMAMLNKGWQWYYRKYIDVKRGGIGGIAMLVAGYCVLSYIWNYPHLKQERWRKYH